MGSSLWPPSWQWLLVPLRSSLDLTQRLRLIPGTDTTDTDTGHTDMDTMATDTTDTMERDLLMLSPLPMPLPVLRPRLIPGTDTTDTGHTAMDTMATDLMDMDTTMERGLLVLSPLPMPLPVLRLRPIPGTDTTDTATGLTAMDTMATDLTVMPTGVKLRPTTTSCFSLPTLL